MDVETLRDIQNTGASFSVGAGNPSNRDSVHFREAFKSIGNKVNESGFGEEPLAVGNRNR
jgi:hypothetical protein